MDTVAIPTGKRVRKPGFYECVVCKTREAFEDEREKFPRCYQCNSHTSWLFVKELEGTFQRRKP
jgi:hypothetical protein